MRGSSDVFRKCLCTQYMAGRRTHAPITTTTEPLICLFRHVADQLSQHAGDVCAGATAWGTNQLTVDRRWLEAARKVRPSAGGADARTLVSCGAPMVGVEVAIADTDTLTRVVDGGVGEVWLRSACVTAGYYGHPELSAATFQVRKSSALATGMMAAGPKPIPTSNCQNLV